MADDTSFMEGYISPTKGRKESQPVQQSSGEEFMSGYMKPGEQLTEQPKVSTGEDVARSVFAKGVRGAAALPGMLGDVPKIFGAEKTTFPTTEEYIQKLSSFSPAVQKALEYKAETGPGRYAGSVAEFLPSAALALLPGGQAPLAARLGLGAVGAAGSGVGSQAVEDFYNLGEIPGKGTPYEAGAKLAGAVAGGLAAPSAASRLASLARGPESVAASRFAAAQAKDITTGTGAADFAAGAAPATAAGKATEALLKSSAAKASDEGVGAYNAAIEGLKQDVAPRIEKTMEGIFNRPIQMFDEQQILNDRIRQTNSQNYTRVMALPEAQFIQSPELTAVMGRLPKGTMEDVLEQMRIRGDNPAEFGLVPKGKSWSISPQGASLKFWDEVKQSLDSQIGSYTDPVTKTIQPGAGRKVANLTGVKSSLVGVLDDAVKDYKNIRFEASELYEARNAVEAGYRYFGDRKPKKLDELRRYVDQKLTPEQKQEFAYGYAAAYRDQLYQNPTDAIRGYFGKLGQFNIDKMRFALGDDAANQLLGSVNTEFLNNSLRQLSGGSQGLGLLKGAGSGYAAGLAGEAAFAGSNILQALSFTMSPTAIAGMILGGAGKAVYTVRERKIADQVLRLASDPNESARLGKLIAENADARSFLAKLYGAIGRNVPPVTAQTAAPMPQKEENQGGRIERASGGRIGAQGKAFNLIKMAELAKRRIGKETEQILDRPDEVVVKALQVANRNLEG